MISRALTISFFLLFSVNTSAENDERVYRVEIIVFERGSRASGHDQEHWRKNIELSYPENWVRLVSPQEAEAIQSRQSAGEAEQFTLSDGFFRSIGDTSQPTDTAQQNQTENDNDASRQDRYYRFLPDANKTLKQTARGLNRAGSIRTLFHETWLQPFPAKQKPPHLVLRGGNVYDDHAELEGSIRLTLSRYLHIETNIWFTEFVPNYGQAPSHWPELPDFPTNYLDSDELPPPPASDSEFNSFMVDSSQAEKLANEQLNLTSSKFDERIDAVDQEAQKPYLIQQTITLQQTRRMRSNELHYIDHPRLGVLVKIFPYTSENTGDKNE